MQGDDIGPIGCRHARPERGRARAFLLRKKSPAEAGLAGEGEPLAFLVNVRRNLMGCPAKAAASAWWARAPEPGLAVSPCRSSQAVTPGCWRSLSDCRSCRRPE